MSAKTIRDVRDKLSQKGTAEKFSHGFAQVYFGQAMGSLPKSEIDLLVFTLLIDLKVIAADGPIFAIARALNITPAKARSLLFQYQLRHVDDTVGDQMVAATLAKANFSVDEKRLSFGIESPLVRAIIDSKLKERGVFADISLSGEILRVPLVEFDQFIELLMGKKKAGELEKALKKDGYLKGSTLNAFLKKYGAAAAKGAAGAAGKEGFSAILDGVSDFMSGDGVDVMSIAMAGFA
jgi:hypothetical protein